MKIGNKVIRDSKIIRYTESVFEATYRGKHILIKDTGDEVKRPNKVYKVVIDKDYENEVLLSTFCMFRAIEYTVRTLL